MISNILQRSFAASVILAALGTPLAHAVVITYDLGGDLSETVALNETQNATVTLTADPQQSLDLTPNVTQQVFFLGGTVSLPGAPGGNGTGTLAPTLTITSRSATQSSQTLTQSVSIFQSLNLPDGPATTDFILGSGSTVMFNLDGQYTLSVTPLGNSRIDQVGLSIPFGYSADFLLTPIPEPAGLAVFAGCALMLTRRRR